MGCPGRTSESRPQIWRMQSSEEILQSGPFPAASQAQPRRHQRQMDEYARERLHEGRATARETSKPCSRSSADRLASPTCADGDHDRAKQHTPWSSWGTRTSYRDSARQLMIDDRLSDGRFQPCDRTESSLRHLQLGLWVIGRLLRSDDLCAAVAFGELWSIKSAFAFYGRGRRKLSV